MYYAAVVDQVPLHGRSISVRHTPEEVMAVDLKGTHARIVPIPDHIVGNEVAILRWVREADRTGKSVPIGGTS